MLRNTLPAAALAALFLFGGPGPAPAQSPQATPQPSTTPQQEGLTREKAVDYLSSCERVWYAQVYLVQSGTYLFDNLEHIDQNRIISRAVRLFALEGNRYALESILDSRDNGANAWKRGREIESFDGKLRYEWTDYENEGAVTQGSGMPLWSEPDNLTAFFGLQQGRPLSSLLRDADKFEWGDTEIVLGDKCLKANCIYRSEGDNAFVRYQLSLAVEGALFPKRIVRWVDRGDGEGPKLVGVWEALAVDKDPKTRLWQLRQGRYINPAAKSIYMVQVLNRGGIPQSQGKSPTLTLNFPPDCLVRDMRTGQYMNKAASKSSVLHPETTFLKPFLNMTVPQALTMLDRHYPGGQAPPWEIQFASP